MENIIPRDVSRCVNKECTEKHHCKRWIQYEKDLKQGTENHPVPTNSFKGGIDCERLLNIKSNKAI